MSFINDNLNFISAEYYLFAKPVENWALIKKEIK